MMNYPMDDVAASNTAKIFPRVRNKIVYFGSTGHENSDSPRKPLGPQLVELAVGLRRWPDGLRVACDMAIVGGH